MKRELLSKAVGDIDARYIDEAVFVAPAGAPERKTHMKPRKIITLALAAVLLLSLSVAAYAAHNAVASPQAAERVALEQLAVWREMGLLQPDFVPEGPATQIMEFEEYTGSDYWYGRLFPHEYSVRWYGQGKYSAILSVDTLTGKILYATLMAKADEGRESVGQTEVLRDPDNPDQGSTTLYFYDNFEDIFPADMTVDRYCSLLAEYWGFTGYRLADTVDDFYQEAPWEAVAGDSLLRDMHPGNTDNYYLTIFFDGDQEGAPMYLQVEEFPGEVCLMLGTGHAVG